VKKLGAGEGEARLRSWAFKGRSSRYSGKLSSTLRCDKGADSHQSRYPTIIEEIRLQLLREAKAAVTVVTAWAVILATIMEMEPDILHQTFQDGSTFKASEMYVHSWLHDAMQWSWRKATRAAHKLPTDWEDQCECSFF
jgi:hypothetical protein